ncbi:MAG: phosphoadenosine phosphosulfate reductase family protein [Chloroflexi bacterium]|nr:phosphoadenosine phosphosulfate reductase family protein [Chloroflexota bacterium]
MTAIERGDRAHARTRGFERRVSAALAAVEQATAYGRIGVSYSGGKDSTVTLDLVRRIVPGAPAALYDSGCEYSGTLEMAAHYGAEIIKPEMSLVELCRYGGYWGYARPVDDEVDINFMAFLVTEPAIYFAEQQHLDVIAMGLRAQESGARRMNAWKRGTLYFAEALGVWHLCPLAFWMERDVWAYIASRGLRYHPAYDKMAELGIPRVDWRISMAMGEVQARVGGLSVWRQIEPERYNALIADFPMLAGFT